MPLSKDPKKRKKQLAKINAITGGKKGEPTDAFEKKQFELEKLNKGQKTKMLQIQNIRIVSEEDMKTEKPQTKTLVVFKNLAQVRLEGKVQNEEAAKRARKIIRNHPANFEK